MSDSVGQVTIGLGLDTTSFDQSLSRVNSRLGQIGQSAGRASGGLGGLGSTLKKIGGVVAGAFAVKEIISFGKSCLDLGSDLTEVQNVVNTAFPGMAGKVSQWSQQAAESFGLSETMAKRYTGTLGSMAKAFGFSEKEAADMSMSLAGLAGDVASFYNISQDDAYTKLKSVFTGETESLKDLGVVMTQTALDQYALANGFGRTTSAMSEQEKVALRYSFVQAQLKDASGDFAKTASGSWANQIRILSLSFDSLRASIGQILINALLPVVKGINFVMGKLVSLARGFASVFGMDLSVPAQSVSDLGGSIADTSAATAGLGNTATKAATKAAGATKKAAKEAKKYMKQIMGFDQINRLDKQDSSSGGSDTGGTGGGGGGGSIGGGGGALAGTLASTGKETDSLSKKTAGLLSKYKNLGAAVRNLKGAFGEFTGIIKGGLKWVWDNILKPLGQWTLDKGAPAVINLLAAAFKVVNSVLKALQPLWQWLWDNMLSKIAKFAGNVFVTFLGLLTKALEGLSSWIDKHQTAVQNIAIIIGSFLGAFLAKKLVVGLIMKIGGAIGSVLSVIGKLGGFIAANPIVLIIGAVIAAGVLLWKNWDKIKVHLKKFIAFFKAGWEGLKKNVTKIIDKVKEKIAKLKEAWESIKSKAATLVAEAKEKVEGAIALLKAGWEAVKDKAASLVAEAKEKAEGALAALKTGWEAVKDRTASLVAEAKEKASGALALLKAGWEVIVDRAPELLAEAKEKVSGALAKLKEGWEAVKEKAVALTAEAKEKVKGAIDDLKSKWEDWKAGAKELLTEAKEKAGNLISTIKNTWETWGPVAKSLLTEAKEKAGSLISTIKNTWANWSPGTKTLYAEAKEKVKGAVNSLINAFAKLPSGTRTLTTKVSDKASKTISAIKTTWDKFKNNKKLSLKATISDGVSKTLKTVAGLWDKLKGGAIKLKASFVDSITGPIQSAWSGIAGGLNKAIGIINKIPGVNISPVPTHLAQGGYVKRNTPQLAVVGDNTRYGEIVAPENKMNAMADRAAMQAAGAGSAQTEALLRAILQAVLSIDADTYLDGKKVTDVVVKNINARTKATGKPAIII